MRRGESQNQTMNRKFAVVARASTSSSLSKSSCAKPRSAFSLRGQLATSGALGQFWDEQVDVQKGRAASCSGLRMKPRQRPCRSA